MAIETNSAHITNAGGNIFVDLGFEEQEAKVLHEESQRRIAEKLTIKGAQQPDVKAADRRSK